MKTPKLIKLCKCKTKLKNSIKRTALGFLSKTFLQPHSWLESKYRGH